MTERGNLSLKEKQQVKFVLLTVQNPSLNNYTKLMKVVLFPREIFQKMGHHHSKTVVPSQPKGLGIYKNWNPNKCMDFFEVGKIKEYHHGAAFYSS